MPALAGLGDPDCATLGLAAPAPPVDDPAVGAVGDPDADWPDPADRLGPDCGDDELAEPDAFDPPSELGPADDDGIPVLAGPLELPKSSVGDGVGVECGGGDSGRFCAIWDGRSIETGEIFGCLGLEACGNEPDVLPGLSMCMAGGFGGGFDDKGGCVGGENGGIACVKGTNWLKETTLPDSPATTPVFTAFCEIT